MSATGFPLVGGGVARDRKATLASAFPTQFFVCAAVGYNGVLAALNAHAVHQSFATVAASEILILLVALTYAILGDRTDRAGLAIIAVGVTVSVFRTLATQAFSPDCARATLIIGVFYMLGARVGPVSLLTTFRMMSIVVLVCLVLEIADTQLYVDLFQPSQYYASTRNLRELSSNTTGLFSNALGFAGRFSFGLSDHRTASIFIEQVSLANYAGVLTVFVLATVGTMAGADRALHIGTLALILLTNNTRTSTTLAVLSVPGFFIYPLLGRLLVLLIMPAILATGFLFDLIMNQGRGAIGGDDLAGRISTTMTYLRGFDLGSFFGFDSRNLGQYLDSGYAYVIAGSTVLGLVSLWLLLAFAIPARQASHKRCLFGASLYFACNLMIGGTAVFSIKAGAPLWFLLGCLSTHSLKTHRNSRATVLPPRPLPHPQS